MTVTTYMLHTASEFIVSGLDKQRSMRKAKLLLLLELAGDVSANDKQFIRKFTETR